MNFREIYNECNQLSENTEISPYFEKVYFECNVKPLFEQVLREANKDSRPESYAVFNGNNLLKNSGPTSKNAAYEEYKKTPAHGLSDPTLSRANLDGTPYYQDYSEEKVKDDQNILISSVNQFDEAEMDNAWNIFSKNILKRMKISNDPRELIALLKQTDPKQLDAISNKLYKILKNNFESC